jgi:hypothetical protein
MSFYAVTNSSMPTDTWSEFGAQIPTYSPLVIALIALANSPLVIVGLNVFWQLVRVGRNRPFSSSNERP